MEEGAIKILTIDDELVVRRSFKHYLEDCGYDVVEAENGRHGLQIFAEEGADLILVDLRMPEVDGLEVIASVKESSPTTPIIVISGTGVISDAIGAVRMGAWDFILKPIDDMSILRYSIERCLEKFYLLKRNREYKEHLEEMVEKRAGELKEANIRLKASEERFRSLIETSSDCIWEIDLDSVITYISPKVKDFTGYTVQEAIGREFYRVFKEEDCVLFKEKFIEYLQKREPLLRIKHNAIHKNGSISTLEESAVPYLDNDGVLVGYRGIARDITERAKAEEEIKRMNETLELRVKQRTEELQSKMEELKATQEQLVESEKMSSLGTLVAGVAHEINTPIGIGVTDASYLEEKTVAFSELFHNNKLTRADFEEYIGKTLQTTSSLTGNLQRAADLITSFKQVAVDRSSHVPRRFRVKRYLEDTLKSLHAKLKRTSHEVLVTCEDALEIFSYPGFFSQIITNFIMNSLIHAFEDEDEGEIKIDVSTDRGMLIMKYSDNGRGMEPVVLKHLFEPFFTTKRGHGGSGLGMHIVYNLVTQSLDGQISCMSRPGEGTTFTLIIPLMLEENYYDSK